MTQRLPRAVLFDLDDTLIQHEDPDAAWARTLSRFAPEVGADAGELLKALTYHRTLFWNDPELNTKGRFNVPWATRTIVGQALGTLGISNEPLAHKIADTFRAERDGKDRLYPGAIQVLEWLRREGVRLAMVTNGMKETQRSKIERHGLARFFDCILVEGEFGIGKPDPRVFRYALAQLEAGPSDAWMVGNDLHFDIEGGKGVGLFTVWVDAARAGIPEGSLLVPDRTVHTVAELLENMP